MLLPLTVVEVLYILSDIKKVNMLVRLRTDEIATKKKAAGQRRAEQVTREGKDNKTQQETFVKTSIAFLVTVAIIGRDDCFNVYEKRNPCASQKQKLQSYRR